MKKAAIELSMRTIILLILFLIIIVVLVIIGSKLSIQGTGGVENLTNIAEGFKPGR